MNHQLDYSRRCSPDFAGHKYSAMRGQRESRWRRARVSPRWLRHKSFLMILRARTYILCSTIHRHPLHEPSLISGSSRAYTVLSYRDQLLTSRTRSSRSVYTAFDESSPSRSNVAFHATGTATKYEIRPFESRDRRTRPGIVEPSSG